MSSRFVLEAEHMIITRKAVLKFDESQHPRDEDGRFTSGVGSERELYESGGKVQIDHRWFGGYTATAMRATLAGPIPDVNAGLVDGGSFLGMTGREVESLHQGALDIVAKINAAPRTTANIYRGIGLHNADYAAFRSDMAPGKTVDLNLSSWTSVERIANSFARNVYGTVPDTGLASSPPHVVVFDLAPGAHALDVHGEAPEFQQFARETLTAGRFIVTSVDHVEEYEPRGQYMPTSTLDTIHLQQAATLNPDQLVGTKVEQLTEPPRFLDWLEPYMDQRMVPPKDAQKFDPSEPRDERGRWAAGADAMIAGDPIETPSGPRYHTDGALTRWPDLPAALRDYSTRHPDTKLLGVYTGKPIEMMAALNQIEHLQQQFPNVPLKSLSMWAPSLMSHANGPTAIAQANYNGAGTDIRLNSQYWSEGQFRSSLYNPDSGFSAPGTSDPSGLITHEFGHALENWLSTDTKDGGAGLWEQKYNWWNGGGDYVEGVKTLMQGVSGYAKTNDTEAFAEAFASAYTPGAPATEAGDTLRMFLEQDLAVAKPLAN